MNYTTEELLQLAIRAMNSKEDDHALNYLNQAYDQDPESAAVNYLLAAEFAQMGLYEKALNAFSSTLKIDPKMHYARFQNALLQLTLNITSESKNHFKLLTEQEDNPELKIFSEGMLELINENFDKAQALLIEGKAINSINPALNLDVDKILKEIDNYQSGNTSKDDNNSVFLSVYKNKDEKD